jgi:predicted AlkP superfamily phosphohydrolase/phosphomutase
MKLLVIGIDGGTKSIIEGMPMPFTQSLFKEAVSEGLEEDLISRGWAEALTGEHASTNKGFYLMPCSDGSYDFSASYSKSDMVSASSNKTLWDYLNKIGVSVGIVNVPTTGPVDQVKGFMVAGGGGGLKATGEVPEGMVHPPSHKQILENNSYVFDVRLPGGEKKVSNFIRKITRAERVQKDTFIELAQLEKPDFGFHCFRITTEVQYLARYEIEKCIKKLNDCKKTGVEFKPDNEIQRVLIDHYSELDESIKSIFQKLEPESYIFIGDHSTAIFEYEGNVDVWLSSKGYLRALSSAEVFVVRGVNFLRRKLLDKIWKNKNPKASLTRRPITRFSKRNTLAFGTFYDSGNFAGIFVNDYQRFGGPVTGAEQEKIIVDKICKDFNTDPISIKYGLEARPYREVYEGAQFQNLMPDIKIHKPDSIYFSSRKWEFVTKNPNLKPLSESLEGIRYPHAGAKGSDPLFVYSKDLEQLVEDNDPRDLRLTYRIITRFFSR